MSRLIYLKFTILFWITMHNSYIDATTKTVRCTLAENLPNKSSVGRF